MVRCVWKKYSKKIAISSFLQELVQKSTNIARKKMKSTLNDLREELEHKEIVARFAGNTLQEKVDRVDAMQKEYYRMDRDRQEMQDQYRICQGGLHEHRDRLTYMENELKRVKDDAATVNR